MYFKVDRKVLKKALIFLKRTYMELTKQHPGEIILKPNYPKYIEQVEFALYKTRMEEFYIDYDFAQAIRPSLLTKNDNKK